MSFSVEFEKLRGRRDAGEITPEEFEEAKKRLLDDCVRRIESFHERKPPAPTRWGLPPFRVIRGVVQSIRISQGEGGEQFSASISVNGRPVEFESSAPILIDAGDRVTFGGYDREGPFLSLAYHNESKGAHSDLSRLRTGYRFLVTFGRASWAAGIAAILGTVILLVLHKPPLKAFHSELWRYVPYVLSGLAAAAVCYLGWCLTFLGARAKEFHDALPWAAMSTRRPS